MNNKTNSKTRLLEAASRVVETRGAAHLTIDAVAAEAGMSKGGVLYHFPSKQLLLEGMLNSLLANYSKQIAHNRQQGNSSLISAWILAEQEQTQNERSGALALLANVAENPELLDPARIFLKQSLTEIRKEAGDKDLNSIVFLATEGLRFFDMLGLQLINDRDRNRLHKRMQELSSKGSR